VEINIKIKNMLWKTKSKATRVSVAIAGILRKCDNITQQDAAYKNKILKLHRSFVYALYMINAVNNSSDLNL
jgi:hypothetical protein